MIYLGNGKFIETDSWDAEFFDDGEGRCRCCREPLYVGGGESSDADGRLAEVVQPDYSKECNCSWEDLRKIDPSVDELRELSEEGKQIADHLDASEEELFLLSEILGKTFKEILEMDNLADIYKENKHKLA